MTSGDEQSRHASAEQLLRIKRRGAGFEADYWGAFRLDLEHRLLRIARGKCTKLLLSEDDRLDFVNDLLNDHYDGRILNGELLADWDETKDVLQRYVAPGFVWLKALEWRRRAGVPGVGGEDSAVDSFADPSFGTSRRPVGSKLLSAIGVALENIRISVPNGKIPQTVLDAGLQMFPRIDWSLTEHARLLTTVHSAVVAAPSGDPVQILTMEHQLAARQLLSEISEFAEKITDADRRGNRRSARTVMRFRARQDKARLDLTFRPLSAEALMRLLNLTDRTIADQRRCRYWKRLQQLPALIPELKGLFDLLNSSESEET